LFTKSNCFGELNTNQTNFLLFNNNNSNNNNNSSNNNNNNNNSNNNIINNKNNNNKPRLFSNFSTFSNPTVPFSNLFTQQQPKSVTFQTENTKKTN
jgi:hypothetical protein